MTVLPCNSLECLCQSGLFWLPASSVGSLYHYDRILWPSCRIPASLPHPHAHRHNVSVVEIGQWFLAANLLKMFRPPIVIVIIRFQVRPSHFSSPASTSRRRTCSSAATPASLHFSSPWQPSPWQRLPREDWVRKRLGTRSRGSLSVCSRGHFSTRRVKHFS